MFLDDQLSAIRMISLDRKEAEEFYEVYRDVVAEYAQMVKNFKIISIYNYFTGWWTFFRTINCHRIIKRWRKSRSIIPSILRPVRPKSCICHSTRNYSSQIRSQQSPKCNPLYRFRNWWSIRIKFHVQSTINICILYKIDLFYSKIFILIKNIFFSNKPRVSNANKHYGAWENDRKWVFLAV